MACFYEADSNINHLDKSDSKSVVVQKDNLCYQKIVFKFEELNIKNFISLLLLLSMVTTANANIRTKEVEYTAGDATMIGFLAYDDSIAEKRPGILVVHEWWGHNDYARKRAQMLAKIGYTAFAVDMYGDGKTADHPKKAGEYVQATFKNWDSSRARFNEAVKVLRSHPTVEPKKIASIGYCFGGAISIRMARSGANLKGVVAFHGALPLEPPIKNGEMKAAVLVINGSEDNFLKSDTVASFMKQMYEANADLAYFNLSGIKHSYTNPMADELGKKFNIPNLRYSKEADQRSWTAMRRFLDRIFNKN